MAAFEASTRKKEQNNETPNAIAALRTRDRLRRDALSSSWKKGGRMLFEFVQTDQNQRFFERLPKFLPAFERLMALANKDLGRAFDARNHAQDICFSLGHTCREDYLEILFLVANGYGTGASKLLRGLYERVVTLAYIAKHPDKAERFLHFAAIQEFRAMKSALKIVSEEEFDESFGTGSVAGVTERYERFKPEFPSRALSWDGSLISMVEDLGAPYDKYYLGSYTIPNFDVHATYASAFDGTPENVRAERDIKNADFALLNATACLLFALREQNRLPARTWPNVNSRPFESAMRTYASFSEP
jgi:hypothetical protein